MGECWSRASAGESPIVEDVEAAPTKCSCGRFGVFYTVLGNVNFGIILACVLLYGPIWFAASLGNAKNLFALFTSLVIGGLLVARRFIRNPRPIIALILNVTLLTIMSVTILPFFLAVGPVITANKRSTFDRYIVGVDKALLGWMYPEGQMSLALDRSPTLNPTTGFGRFYTDALQLAYMSYYLWGYVPLIFLGIRYTLAMKRGDGATVNRSLAQLKLYMTGWLSAFLMVFVLNTIFPALSPRLYFVGKANSERFSAVAYQHPRLEGFGLAKILIGAATDNNSFGSFPSGHFGESVVAGVYMWRVNRIGGIIIFVASFFIGVATQALRYHYFADLLGAGIVAVLSLTFGFGLTGTMFRRETARIVASYATHAGLPMYIETNSQEMATRSDDSSVSLDDGEFDNEKTSEVDLEMGTPEASSPSTSNGLVNTYI